LWEKIEEDERLLVIDNTEREKKDERGDYTQESFASNFIHLFS